LFFLKKKYDSTKDYGENKGWERWRNRTRGEGTGMGRKPGCRAPETEAQEQQTDNRKEANKKETDEA